MPDHPDWVVERLEQARVAVLGTVDRQGRPHLVPIVFVYHDRHLYTAVDDKPKTSRQLRRLDNIAAHPAVSVLVDHYEDDWSRLWWIRVDGTARIEPFAQTPPVVSTRLAQKYPAYAKVLPPGPVIAIHIDRIRSWSAR